MKFLSQIQPISLREQVVEQVRAAIVEGRLKPGDHVTEAILTEQLGVSRTPVREALILLEREGLVLFAPNRGAFVRAFKADEVDDVFSMRTTLENFAAELSIEKMTNTVFKQLDTLVDQQQACLDQSDFRSAHSIDMEFHRLLVHASSHRVLVRNWEEIVAQIALLLYLRSAAMPEDHEYQAIRDHRMILEAYRARDLTAVQEANRRINRRVAEECRHVLQSS